jgi:polyribonucleotide nucleotidyltransferase
MGPIGAARVGYKDGEYQLNPSLDECKSGELDLVVAATQDAGDDGRIRSQGAVGRVMLGAVSFAHDASRKVIDAIISSRQSASMAWRENSTPASPATYS